MTKETSNADAISQTEGALGATVELDRSLKQVAGISSMIGVEDLPTEVSHITRVAENLKKKLYEKFLGDSLGRLISKTTELRDLVSVENGGVNWLDAFTGTSFQDVIEHARTTLMTIDPRAVVKQLAGIREDRDRFVSCSLLLLPILWCGGDGCFPSRPLLQPFRPSTSVTAPRRPSFTVGSSWGVRRWQAKQ
eukprot:63445-Pyramimonas_sp.AAC.1